MKDRSLISINDFSKEEYIKILDLAEKFEINPREKMEKSILPISYVKNIENQER